MKDDDFIYKETGSEQYRTITQIDGVRTTVCENRFEIIVRPDCEVWEQQAVQMLRDWVRKRQEKLRSAGGVSG